MTEEEIDEVLILMRLGQRVKVMGYVDGNPMPVEYFIKDNWFNWKLPQEDHNARRPISSTDDHSKIRTWLKDEKVIYD